VSVGKVGQVCVAVLAVGSVVLFRASREFDDRSRMIVFAAGGALMVACLVIASLGQINRDIANDRDRRTESDDQEPPTSTS
jgi:hypothetical protein